MTVAPIITRIAITREEYDAVRKRAIDVKMTTAELLAEIVRAALAGKGSK